jgi:hypothetical protein
MGQGGAAEIARVSVVGAELHMRHDLGVCWIGHGELSAALPLRLRDQPRRRHSTTLLVWTTNQEQTA